ncbi:hypothetical protein PTTG_12514 [Puccinia triticina 1-1 BBBD Race 1]|uniref:Secreted protein n=2 Tax=Puccinia triticina TaxID=208348 RepID=A0A180G4N7_PUCT1|nr:uncharacterized protein PtA15_7A253 [Puccinia triticina]OAV87568.1 hypothetical protein PTTG_12514 [Puccinia triticina 1-1 BBBD Race 1]WAQ86527.1 hypothetical protein PtA15_7A253 [Puccinia triticina]WAR56396.1 hypothetical protein PtB15_7B244 [Puccinia triticina]
MRLSVYVLLCLAAALTIIQAQQLSPSSITCEEAPGPTIIKDDCQKSLRQFPTEANVISWEGGHNFRSCGTCNITITEPSLPYTALRRTAYYKYVLTAMTHGLDKCMGKFTNATIGTSGRISVLLAPGNGEKCRKH